MQTSLAHQAPHQINNFQQTVCLEGNAGSGKTTCCAELTENADGVFVREHTEMLDAEHRDYLMRLFEGRTYGGDFSIWELAEERRAKTCSSAGFKQVFLDTSFVSVVGFELAQRKFDRSRGNSATLRGYQGLISEGKLLVPGRFVHLKVSEAVRQSRLQTRGSCHPFLARSDVSQYLDEIRENFFRNYLPRSCWISIDASRLSQSEATAQVETALTTLEVKEMTEAFSAWLAELLAQ